MTTYTDVFSTNPISSSASEYAAFSLTADSTFHWSYNYTGTGNTVAELMEISCSVGVVLTMPAADEVSKGESCIIRNVGAQTLTVKKSNGDALTTVASGAAALIYVKDNSTAEGTWGSFTYGTGTSAVDAASLIGQGVMAIGSTLNAALQTSVETTAFAVSITDRAKSFIFTGGAETATLPDVTTLPDDWFCIIKNAGSGVLTVDPSGAQTINDQLTLSLNPGESAFLVSTSTEWFEIGQGRSTNFQFTQLIKDVSAAGTFTLTAAEASNKLFKFIGSPGAAVTIVVPPVVSVYYTNSAISTVQNITVKTAAEVGGITIPQGARSTLFCDSVSVLDAQTATVGGIVSLDDGAVGTPSIRFTNDIDTGLYNLVEGLGFSVGGTAIGKFTVNGLEVTQGYLKIPGVTSPSHTAEGGMVWDTDSDLLTVGTGAARKTMVDTDTAQTLTNKALTSPTLTTPAINGTVTTTGLTLPAFTSGAINGTTITLSGAINGTTIPTSKTLVITDDVIAIAKGGTGQTTATAAFDAIAPTTTKGDVIVSNGTDNIRLAVGTNDYVLKANSATASGLEWVALPAAEVTLAGAEILTNKTLTSPVLNGTVTTTGLTMPAFTGGAINGTTIPTSKTLVASDGVKTVGGQTLIGSGNIAGGWEYITSSTVSGAAACTLDVIDATYQNYMVVAENILNPGAASSDFLNCQLKIGGAYLTTNYAWETSIATSSSNDTVIRIGGAPSSTLGTNFMLFIGPQATGYEKLVSYSLSGWDYAGNYFHATGGGSHATTTALTGIRFQVTGGTITGNFKIYGLREA